MSNPAPKSCFITGTDTGIGKTRFALELMRYGKQLGLNVAGMKPVACGSVKTDQGYRNEDALAIQAECSRPQRYEDVNPYAYLDPVAPLIAAIRENRSISMETIIQAYDRLRSTTELIVIEGIGGWKIHLDEEIMLSNLVARLQLPVILVVGLRLGCLNHALLTVECIHRDGLTLCGWVANSVDSEFTDQEESIRFLQRTISAPLLARMPYACPTLASEIYWEGISNIL